jgi:hypothetical protein
MRTGAARGSSRACSSRAYGPGSQPDSLRCLPAFSAPSDGPEYRSISLSATEISSVGRRRPLRIKASRAVGHPSSYDAVAMRRGMRVCGEMRVSFRAGSNARTLRIQVQPTPMSTALPRYPLVPAYPQTEAHPTRGGRRFPSQPRHPCNCATDGRCRRLHGCTPEQTGGIRPSPSQTAHCHPHKGRCGAGGLHGGCSDRRESTALPFLHAHGGVSRPRPLRRRAVRRG